MINNTEIEHLGVAKSERYRWEPQLSQRAAYQCGGDFYLHYDAIRKGCSASFEKSTNGKFPSATFENAVFFNSGSVIRRVRDIPRHARIFSTTALLKTRSVTKNCWI